MLTDEPEEEDDDSTQYEPHPRELAIFMFQLKSLVQALLLIELGFDQRTINEKLKKSAQYRRIRAIRSRVTRPAARSGVVG